MVVAGRQDQRAILDTSRGTSSRRLTCWIAHKYPDSPAICDQHGDKTDAGRRKAQPYPATRDLRDSKQRCEDTRCRKDPGRYLLRQRRYRRLGKSKEWRKTVSVLVPQLPIQRLREVVAAGNRPVKLQNTGRIALIAVPSPEESRTTCHRGDVERRGCAAGLAGPAHRQEARPQTGRHAATPHRRNPPPGFHGEWKVKRLGELGAFLKGSGIRKDEVVTEGFPSIRYGEIYTHHHDHVRAFNSFITPETAQKSRRLEKGDLLFAGSGETARKLENVCFPLGLGSVCRRRHRHI